MRKSFFGKHAHRNYKLMAMLIILALFQITQGTPLLAAPEVKSQQSSGVITGVVTDKSGEPVIGATVSVKGTNNGVMTDLDGKYTISNVPSDATLEVSYLGMKTQQVAVKNQSIINVLLEDDSVLVDEVVVVGYGTQKKVNLTGAVSAVKFDEQLSSRSLPNASLALQGKIPGLAISQNSGMAGRSDIEMLVRGMGTTNNASPLIVVDGMPDVSLSRLNMDDIESVSVLKDAASSAIYGSRAANGVILITTKSGRETKPQINVSGSYTLGKPIHATEMMADYPRSLTLLQRNEAVKTFPAQFTFKDGTIDQWMALGMIDPLRYPNTDWYDVILRDAETQKYNISATGGGTTSNYYMSIGVLDEKGLLINNDYTRYNARINYNAKIRPNLNVGVRFGGDWSDMKYALTDNFDGTISPTEMRYAIAGITPYDPLTGYYGGVMAIGEDPMAFNPYNAYLTQLTKQQRQEANLNGFIEWTPIKGLVAQVDYSLRYFHDFRYKADTPSQAYNFQTDALGSRIYVGKNAGIENYTYQGYKTQLTGRLNYNVTLSNVHDLGAMIVYSEEFWYDRYQMSGRLDRLHPSLHEIDGALTGTQTTAGNSTREGLISYIGRLNYAAYQKYLFEFNLRADASSRFLKGHQWGYFPSASVGWRFSEESFIKTFADSWMTLGKFRGSYGSLGNNSGVGRYEQQETLKAENYMINGSIAKGYVNTKMINRNLTWELTKVLNLGFDFGFLSNRLTAELDYYDRLTTRMNRPSTFSIHLSGAYSPPPRRNIGELRNRGIEGNFTWKDRIKDLKYTINMNIAYNQSNLEKWNEPLARGEMVDGAYPYLNMPYNYVYAYEAIGIAQTWEDVYNATPQGAQPGDILYKDLNGDGIIDENDLKVFPNIQLDRPTTNFALNASFEWKGFDFSFMLQGAAGRKSFWLTSDNSTSLMPSRQATNWDHWDKPWSIENRDGEWARLGGFDNRKRSTFYLDNLAYLRLKNIQLGYNIPKRFLNKIGLSSLRAYFSTDNVATITNFRGLDPEKRDINDGYPLVKSFTFGLNLGI